MKTQTNSRRCLPFYCTALSLFLGTILCRAADPFGEARQITRYPEAVLRQTGNMPPFTPSETGAAHELPLKRLIEPKEGAHYASALKLAIERLGEKTFLIDTAARGLLLKSNETSGKDIVSVPEWIQPGPGVQTGVFKILGRLSWHEFVMAPAVAELFQAKGFAWVDGIVSTGIFSPWLVRLDLRKDRLSLIPYKTPPSRERTEWEARLDGNWWIVTAQLRNKTAHLILDSGTSRTYIGEQWIQANFGEAPRHSSATSSGEGRYFEAGIWKIEVDGLPSMHISCLSTGAENIPAATGTPIDGVLGFDALHNLALDLDYSAAKLYILR